MKIGLFFGSFNPIHYGHLIIAETALSEAQLDKLWLIVSPQNPFKQKNNLLSEYNRYRMAQLALEDHEQIMPSNVEFSLPKPSFTIDTLTYLFDKYRSYQFVLIMGEDNLEHLHKWKNYEAILANYEIYVYPRPSANVAQEYKEHPKIHYFEAPLLDISATYVRSRLKQNKSIRFLMPDKVRAYIEDNHLYQNS